jgi:hypothetical protein
VASIVHKKYVHYETHNKTASAWVSPVAGRQAPNLTLPHVSTGRTLLLSLTEEQLGGGAAAAAPSFFLNELRPFQSNQIGAGVINACKCW